MATIAEQLTSLANTKAAIKDAIVAKGVTVADTDPFSAYPAKIGQIESGGGAPATKFGCTIDDFFGSVDADGRYTIVNKDVVVDLQGVKTTPAKAFAYFFSGKKVRVFANDLIDCGESSFLSSCMYATSSKSEPVVLQFDSLEVVNTNSCFENCCLGVSYVDASFKRLRSVSGMKAFMAFASSTKISADKVFPALEEISGQQTFSQFTNQGTGEKIIFSKVKKIVGGVSYASTMNFYSKLKYYFPRLVDVSGYVVYSAGASELHFAKAHQSVLEACEGYDYKWGGSNANVYFDLILKITVDGVVYDREYTIDDYTSWKDADGNIIYTSDVAEPDVGTVVYSDQGTTQVGTVSEVA